MWYQEEDRGTNLSSADYKWWYDYGVRDAVRGKGRLSFTGDDVPADWSAQDIAQRRAAYLEGYDSVEL